MFSVEIYFRKLKGTVSYIVFVFKIQSFERFSIGRSFQITIIQISFCYAFSLSVLLLSPQIYSIGLFKGCQ